MQDKKILVILTPESDDATINTFIGHYVRGKNIDMTLCSVSPLPSADFLTDPTVQSVTTACAKQSIPFRVAEVHDDAAVAMQKRASFADLVLMDKEVLLNLALRDDLPKEYSAIIALPGTSGDAPHTGGALSNVILLYDGTAGALKGIKGFFQAFSHYTRNLEVTLLRIEAADYNYDRDEDVLLVEYLRQYADNIGVLTVPSPLIDRNIRALAQGHTPLVVGTLDYLLSLHGSESTFKPLFDHHTTLFIPATNT